VRERERERENMKFDRLLYAFKNEILNYPKVMQFEILFNRTNRFNNKP